METIYFHLVNIPASPKDPFIIKVGGNEVFKTTDTQKDKTLEVQVKPSGLSAIHREFINFLIPEADIDDLQQYDLTNKGYHLRIRVKGLGEVQINQGINKELEEAHETIDEQRKFYVDDKTGEYTYKYNKPVYLAENYQKSPKQKEQKKTLDSVDFSTESTRIWLHLSGIEATPEEPFEVLDVDQDEKVLFKSSKPIFKKFEQMLYIKKPLNVKNHIANLRIKIPVGGVDTVADFNLTTLGTHILIAVLNEGSNVEIQQRKDKFFDEDFFNPIHYANAEREYKQSLKKPIQYTNDEENYEEHENIEPKFGDSNDLNDLTVTFYVNNIPANKNEPFTLFINNEEFFTTKENIPANQMTELKASFTKPEKNQDLIIDVRFKILTKEVDTTQQFNITKNGSFILFAIEKQGVNERIQMKQQHKDTFGANANKNTSSIKQQGGGSSSGTSSGGDSNLETIYFHLVNIHASDAKPFELSVNGQVIYRQTQSLGNKYAIVTGKIPKSKQSNDCKILLRANVKEDGLEEESEVNITKYGNYLKLEVSEDHSVIDITQAKNDEFTDATTVDTKKMPTTGTSTSSSKTTSGNTSGSGTSATSGNKSGGSDDYIDQLRKLAELKNAGILTEEEFQAKKKKILGL
ncbi:hypothetical protein ABK040_014968 [Willaertia magna]